MIKKHLLLAIMDSKEAGDDPYEKVGGSMTTKRNVGHHIQYLKEQGYARTTFCGEDDNGDVLLSLTPAGKSFHARLRSEKAQSKL